MLSNVAASSAARRRAEAGRVMKQNLRIYARLQVGCGGHSGSGCQVSVDVRRAALLCLQACRLNFSPHLAPPTRRTHARPTRPQAIKPSRDVARAAHERDFARHERQLATLAAVRGLWRGRAVGGLV